MKLEDQDPFLAKLIEDAPKNSSSSQADFGEEKETSSKQSQQNTQADMQEEAVLKEIIEQFNHLYHQYLIDAQKVFEKEEREAAAKKIPESLTQNSNPLVRVELALKGLYPEILRDDPVSEVRRQTFIHSGNYSDNYLNEKNSRLIEEFIRQGIDIEFFGSLSEYFHKLAQSVQISENILFDIRSGNEKLLHNLQMDILTFYHKYPDIIDQESVQNALDFIGMTFENSSCN